MSGSHFQLRYFEYKGGCIFYRDSKGQGETRMIDLSSVKRVHIYVQSGLMALERDAYARRLLLLLRLLRPRTLDVANV